MTWLVFGVIAAGLVFAGSKLTLYADQLAEQFGLTRSWVGLLIVGLVTSLPEIATTLSAVTQVDSPDMALGNIFGSVLFNLVILAICDALFRKGGLVRLAGRKNALPAIFDVVILGVMLFGLVVPVSLAFGGGHFSLWSVIVIGIGITAFVVTFHTEHGGAGEDLVVPSPQVSAHRQLILRFSISALAVVVCGYGLAVTGDRLAAQSGLSHTFMGTLFLAIATSLPELVVSVTAIRIGAYDLALGNILGSNVWNVMIVAFSDLAYTREALNVPGNLGWGQVYTGAIGIVATVVVIFALTRRPGKSRLPVGYESIILLALYAACLAGLFFGWGTK